MIPGSAPGPGDVHALGRSGQSDIGQPHLLGASRADRRGVGHESRLEAGDHDDRPFEALGGVERDDVDGVARPAVVARAGGQPGAQGGDRSVGNGGEKVVGEVGEANEHGQRRHRLVVGSGDDGALVVEPRLQAARVGIAGGVMECRPHDGIVEQSGTGPGGSRCRRSHALDGDT